MCSVKLKKEEAVSLTESRRRWKRRRQGWRRSTRRSRRRRRSRNSHFFSVNWCSRHDFPTPMSPAKTRGQHRGQRSQQALYQVHLSRPENKLELPSEGSSTLFLFVFFTTAWSIEKHILKHNKLHDNNKLMWRPAPQSAGKCSLGVGWFILSSEYERDEADRRMDFQ